MDGMQICEYDSGNQGPKDEVAADDKNDQENHDRNPLSTGIFTLVPATVEEIIPPKSIHAADND